MVQLLDRVVAAAQPYPWWLLIHQIPPKPPYLRTKIARRLAKLGAVAVKNSVYVLPMSDSTLEDLQWVRREVVAGGGDAFVCEARFVDGLTETETEGLFRTARDADYHELADAIRPALAALKRRKKLGAAARDEAAALVERARKRLAEITAIDFFAASGREVVDGLLEELNSRLGGDAQAANERLSIADYQSRTWVTRQNIHVDRIACTWLIRRFIDPAARFVFVAGKSYAPRAGDLRFDMFDAEFTHEGDQCSFEVLIARFGLRDPGLRAIAEIVHDIDLKDRKFGRADADGVASVISAIALSAADDDARVTRGGALFEDLHKLHGRQ
jgi:hypothetical protein